jgi:hypothetical protein
MSKIVHYLGYINRSDSLNNSWDFGCAKKAHIAITRHGITTFDIHHLVLCIRNIVWRTDSLLGRDLETNNETTAVAMQQHGKHAFTTIELLLEMVLCNPLPGSCNSWTTTMETGGVFCVVHAKELS